MVLAHFPRSLHHNNNNKMDPAMQSMILQKAPPADLQRNMDGLKELFVSKRGVCGNPDNGWDAAVMKKHEIPFQVVDISGAGERPFLKCRYNQHVSNNNAYRSPWTNKWHSLQNNGESSSATAAAAAALTKQSQSNDESDDDFLRSMELSWNLVWDAYKNLYYGHMAVGSVYLSEKDCGRKKKKNGGAFQGLCGIYKECDGGSWHSVHLVSANDADVTTSTCEYRVESHVLIVMDQTTKGKNDENSKMEISACVSKDVVKTVKVQKATHAASHLENLGKIMEANEIDLRSSLERVHIPKTRETVDNIQSNEKDNPQSRLRTGGENPIMAMMRDSVHFQKRRMVE